MNLGKSRSSAQAMAIFSIRPDPILLVSIGRLLRVDDIIAGRGAPDNFGVQRGRRDNRYFPDGFIQSRKWQVQRLSLYHRHQGLNFGERSAHRSTNSAHPCFTFRRRMFEDRDLGYQALFRRPNILSAWKPNRMSWCWCCSRVVGISECYHGDDLPGSDERIR